MQKMSGEQVLIRLIDLLVSYVEELYYRTKESGDIEFFEGERTAYTECLEIIQFWDGAEENGLDWEIEEKFPL